MSTPEDRRGPGQTEFVAMMALMMSLVALSIDAMLPALDRIAAELGAPDPADAQLIVSMLFVGFGFGQLLYGPLSDGIGRKPAIYVGVAIFLVGCAISVLTSDFDTMLVGRVLQGLGASSGRIVTVAVIRDTVSGRAMARIMSFIMAVFILVPVLAPVLGQAILFVAPWRAIFALLLGLALVAVTWFGLRQPESLPPERRIPVSVRNIARGFRIAATNRTTLGYTLAGACAFGPFLTYLSSAQQIFQYQYGLGELFPFAFGALALGIGIASVVNGRIVMRNGMRRIMRVSSAGIVALAALLLAFIAFSGREPPLWLFMAWAFPTFFGFGMIFGNINAAAMEPMGAIAGVASAFTGAVSTVLAIPVGILVGQFVEGTVWPLVAAYGVLQLVALGIMVWADRDHPPGPVTP